MSKRTVVTGLAGALMFASTLAVLSAPAPTDTASCLRINEELYNQAKALHKRTKLIIPREFARVNAALDDYCEAMEFEKARISIAWMETCIKNWRKPYSQGFCMRTKAYFCAIDPASDACKGG
jgi:hypothetical protein